MTSRIQHDPSVPAPLDVQFAKWLVGNGIQQFLIVYKPAAGARRGGFPHPLLCGHLGSTLLSQFAWGTQHSQANLMADEVPVCLAGEVRFACSGTAGRSFRQVACGQRFPLICHGSSTCCWCPTGRLPAPTLVWELMAIYKRVVEWVSSHGIYSILSEPQGAHSQ